MQLDFLLDTGPRKLVSDDVLPVCGQLLPIRLVRNNRARRYLLRLSHAGEVRVTIPRGGSQREGRKLAHDNVKWLEQQWRKHQQPSARNRHWQHGTEIHLRGEPVAIEVLERDSVREIRFGDAALVIDATDEIKPAVEKHLWSLARQVLPPRVGELAQRHEFTFKRLTIRNQRTRWGSCSPSGTISLNWRLVQMPESVSDYIILHELTHTRHLNHSQRFWRELRRVCPGMREAELWIKRHGEKLLPAV